MSKSSNYTVVGMFDDFHVAENAIQALSVAGFSYARVQLHPKRDEYGTTSYGTCGEKGDMRFGIRGLFYPMFSDDGVRPLDDVDAQFTRKGCYVLTVIARDNEEAGRSVKIMHGYHAMSIDKRASR